jgi:hypothetical protein
MVGAAPSPIRPQRPPGAAALHRHSALGHCPIWQDRSRLATLWLRGGPLTAGPRRLHGGRWPLAAPSFQELRKQPAQSEHSICETPRSLPDCVVARRRPPRRGPGPQAQRASTGGQEGSNPPGAAAPGGGPERLLAEARSSTRSRRPGPGRAFMRRAQASSRAEPLTSWLRDQTGFQREHFKDGSLAWLQGGRRPLWVGPRPHATGACAGEPATSSLWDERLTTTAQRLRQGSPWDGLRPQRPASAAAELRPSGCQGCASGRQN